MELLLHMCCGPCTTASQEKFKELGYEVRGFFFNPNIHPYKEFKRRKETLRDYCRQEEIPLEIDDRYLLEDFLRKTVYREQNRCLFCYALRLGETARKAREKGIEIFSTTLLISPYQDHDLLKEVGEEMGNKYGVSFLYEDLRPLFKDSVNMSKQRNMYRQGYCGCIYSEKERYYKKKGEG
ncbi:MAG: hypothetical protein D5R97_02180 [Candidatus Syntrophonatronum acetioxidans]|uniref:Epoxyqueuosine reductase QueH n=1 Tax=Candidatus Syntrophonatronum acetioxidans TaxID=1795816 RepID=A0A424YHB6_9FIRM|nr:MAG: hypothetical protein D5R97_02180 [Candidatus Syntrophonatronum acetioxidans]